MYLNVARFVFRVARYCCNCLLPDSTRNSQLVTRNNMQTNTPALQYSM
jgi:hypothetical protein